MGEKGSVYFGYLYTILTSLWSDQENNAENNV